MLNNLTIHNFNSNFNLINLPNLCFIFFFKLISTEISRIMHNLSEEHTDVDFYLFNITSYPNISKYAVNRKLDLRNQSFLSFNEGKFLNHYSGNITALNNLNLYINNTKQMLKNMGKMMENNKQNYQYQNSFSPNQQNYPFNNQPLNQPVKNLPITSFPNSYQQPYSNNLFGKVESISNNDFGNVIDYFDVAGVTQKEKHWVKDLFEKNIL